MSTDPNQFLAFAWEILKTGAFGIAIVLWLDAQWKHYFPTPYDR